MPKAMKSRVSRRRFLAGTGAVAAGLSLMPRRGWSAEEAKVNFFAAVELTRSALDLLQRGSQPIIVNIGSVLAHRAVPNLIEYCSSKFALHGFSDALRAELVDVGIDVLLVSPGTTQTEIFDRGLGDHSKIPTWSTLGAVAPTRVARQTLRAIRSGRQEVILSPGGKLLVWADRLSPPIVNRLVARLSGPPRDSGAG